MADWFTPKVYPYPCTLRFEVEVPPRTIARIPPRVAKAAMYFGHRDRVDLDRIYFQATALEVDGDLRNVEIIEFDGLGCEGLVLAGKTWPAPRAPASVFARGDRPGLACRDDLLAEDVVLAIENRATEPRAVAAYLRGKASFVDGVFARAKKYMR